MLNSVSASNIAAITVTNKHKICHIVHRNSPLLKIVQHVFISLYIILTFEWWSTTRTHPDQVNRKNIEIRD